MSNDKDDRTTIPDGVRLFRRIDPNKIVFDYNRGEWRPTSQNFQNTRGETSMSVFAENIAELSGEQPADFLRGRWSLYLLAAVRAGDMRMHGQKVYLDLANQDPDDFHPSHAAVDGPKESKLRQKLAENYEWVVPPSNRYSPPDK
jgi:hypothetical protein